MSPEQARDSSAADGRSDLYSLGSTWFHLLTGQAPFPEGGLGERLIKIMTEQPPDARDLNARVSDDSWAILSKLLEKDPNDRYQTPQELIEALIGLEGSAVASPKAARKAVRKKTARKPRPDEDTAADADAPATAFGESKPSRLPFIVGGALALCAIAAVFAFFAWPKKRDRSGDQVVTPPDHQGTIVEPQPDDRIVQPKDKDKDKDKDGIKPPKDKDREKPPPIVEAKWPALYRPVAKIDLAGLKQEIDKPFGPQLDVSEPFLARVSRLGGPGT